MTVDDIVKATGGKVLCGKQHACAGFSIDSRKIKSEEFFIALRGSRFDGHDFILEALQTGSGALVSIPPAVPCRDRTIIYVRNTLKALHDIARYRKRKRDLPVISITGTNGKTTTKEMIAAIFSQRHRVLKTSGNYNNNIGLPLCVANMQGDEEVMVLEMGSNARGDIRELCEIIRPETAVVTNVGEAHLEGFGSLDAVRDTDLEVMDYAKTVLLNADDRFLMEGCSKYRGRIITYGLENRADYAAQDIVSNDAGQQFLLRFPDNREVEIHLRVSGRFNVLNALAASSAARESGVGEDDIIAGLGAFTGVPMRLEIRRIAGAVVVNDVYNANPASMESALQEVARRRKGRSIAVLGDMLELGAQAGKAHRDLVRSLDDLRISILIATGPEMQKASAGFSGAVHLAADAEEARSLLLGMLQEGDTVLIKGSRGMQMEKVAADDGKTEVAEGLHAL